MRLPGIAAIAIATAFFASCAAKRIETRIAPETPRFRLVIATRRSDFKERLVARLVERYRQDAAIEVVPLGALRRVKAEEHDVVLIIESCLAWTMFNPALTAFLRRTAAPEKVVLLMTAADRGWHYSYRGVDAITSASTRDRAESDFAVLSERIDRLAERASAPGHSP